MTEGATYYGLDGWAFSGYENSYAEHCNPDTPTDFCTLASIGWMTSIILWFAIATGALRIIVPLLGVKNNLPKSVANIVSWSTSMMILSAAALWYSQVVPNFAEQYGLEVGFHFWLILFAGLLTLASEIIEHYRVE